MSHRITALTAAPPMRGTLWLTSSTDADIIVCGDLFTYVFGGLRGLGSWFWASRALVQLGSASHHGASPPFCDLAATYSATFFMMYFIVIPLRAAHWTSVPPNDAANGARLEELRR